MGKKKRLLITGSGGFIISNFIRQVFYNKMPYSISSLDRVRDTHIIHNIYINSDHQFYIADITDPHILHVIFEKERPEIVIHAAAETCVDKSINNTMPLTMSNVVGTQNVIDECLKMKSRLIYFSTDGVYGALVSDKESPWTEESPANPTNTYSATKFAGELLIRAAHESHDLQYNIIRPCNNYGPWQSTEKLIPRVISCILNNREIPVYGKGDNIRDWLHVYDTCSALLSVIDSGVPNEVYNITAKQEFINLEVIQIICNTLESGHHLIKHVEDRSRNDFRCAMTNDKIKSLGWKPQHKFRDGIQQTCQWYVSNQYVLNI